MSQPHRVKDHPAPARRLRAGQPPPRTRARGLPAWLRQVGQAKPVQRKAGRAPDDTP